MFVARLGGVFENDAIVCHKRILFRNGTPGSNPLAEPCLITKRGRRSSDICAPTCQFDKFILAAGYMRQPDRRKILGNDFWPNAATRSARNWEVISDERGNQIGANFWEVISGQCGNQIGAKFWEVISEERGQPDRREYLGGNF